MTAGHKEPGDRTVTTSDLRRGPRQRWVAATWMLGQLREMEEMLEDDRLGALHMRLRRLIKSLAKD